MDDILGKEYPFSTDLFDKNTTTFNLITKFYERAEIGIEDVLCEYFDESGHLYEEGAIKDVAKKSVTAIKGLVKGASSLAKYLTGTLFGKVEEGIKNYHVKSMRIQDYDPTKIRVAVNNALNKAIGGLEKFKKTSGYNKAVVPAASILGWVPPFTPIPGATEAMIAVSSVGEFLLEFKRRWLNQDYNAIKNFELWIDANRDRLSETDIYNCDKLVQRVTNVVTGVTGVIKKMTLSVTQAIAKGVKVASKAGEEMTKSGSKTNARFAKARKISEDIDKETSTVKKKLKYMNAKIGEVNNDLSKEMMADRKDYRKREKKRKQQEKADMSFVTKGRRAQEKVLHGGYKALSKQEYNDLLAFRKKYGEA